MSTIFSLHFYNKFKVTNCYWQLLVRQKSNFNCGFKLESITTYYLLFVVKIL